MSTEAAAEAAVLSSATPWITCIVISWAVWGSTFVQLCTMLASSSSFDKGWRKAALCCIFTLATIDMGMNARDLITTLVVHFGDVEYATTYTKSYGQFLMPYNELAILLLCQAFLIRRCYDFALSFHGKVSVVRRTLFIALAVFSAASFALGAVSMHIIWAVQDLVDIQMDASASGTVSFTILQAGWLAASLAVDVGLTLTITYDLVKAMRFGRNDVGVGGIGQILRQLAILACVNGVVIVAFQLCFLVIIVRDNAGWNDGARTLLPQLQLLSLLTLVNLPRTTLRSQRSADMTRRDAGAEAASAPLPLFSPTASRQQLTALERGRRKLTPLVGKATVRDYRLWPPTCQSGHAVEDLSCASAVIPEDERPLGLQEMLALACSKPIATGG